ncbi:O-antigen ligase family protein [Haloarcula marismortui]|uniref:O-antigen ligase domain-containing protein n=1 Tax=Haloarcula marismortui (strain ATCC 43049 / DSM 3752 / JCM 8966 / VKM B-1809) TaxID=272569 RepID=A0A4P8JW58_HALMA|nr:O-antigen ligase family protein [Haloarcula marismortui]QCP91218.1 O-antigen ligase domain-containing protein [Haloarcula marismortui ATCC 43049]
MDYEYTLFIISTSALPVLFADLLSILGVIRPGATSVSVIPFLQLGMIGVPVSFGTHGTVLATSFFASLGLLAAKKTNYIYYTICFATIMFILISQSRSSILAIILPLVLGAFIFSTTYKRLISLLTGVCIISSLMIYLIIGRLSTVIARLNQYEQALLVIIDHPYVGLGWDKFFIQYGTHLHNTPLNYFVASGLLTGLVFTLCLIYPLYTILNYKNIGRKQNKHIIYIHLAMYSSVIIELLFYPQFPSIHMLIFGSICCAFAEQQSSNKMSGLYHS